MSHPKIEIRYAVPTDNTLLAEFGAKAFSDSFAADNTPENLAAYLAAAFSPQKQADELADPTSVYLIAQIEQEMVGYARLKENPLPVGSAGNRPIELVRIYAGKDWIGYGVGKALMAACLDEARRRGCDSIWLGVWERNPRAIAFYQKWGFGVLGRQIFQLGDDPQTDLVMHRPVTE